MRLVAAALTSLLLALIPFGAAAEVVQDDPLATLQTIRSLFLSGEYEQVVQVTEELLRSEPSMLVRTEGLQYLGASLELLGRTQEAEEQFEVLLTLQPLFHMNQADFPTEVVQLFESVRLRVQDRLHQIEVQRQRAQEAERREREQRLLEQQRRLLQAARTHYLVHEVRPRHLILAFLPFGAGQFQNGQTSRGYAFLGTELGLTGASMLVWLLGTLRSNESEDSFLRYQITSYAIYSALAVTVVWGIIDALVNFRRQRGRADRWHAISEEDVPEEHRVPPDPVLRELEESLRERGLPRAETSTAPTDSDDASDGARPTTP